MRFEFQVFLEFTNMKWLSKKACSGGRMEVVEMMIEKGAKDWNRGLKAAAIYGNLKVAEMMIKKGANNLNELLLMPYNSPRVLQLALSHGAVKTLFSPPLTIFLNFFFGRTSKA